MKALIISGLVVSGLVGGGVAGSALVASPASPPDRVPAGVDCAVTDSCPPPWAGAPSAVPPVAGPDNDDTEADDNGEPASPEGQARREAAMTFVGQMQAWTSCVGEAAPAHDESTGPFDPEAACGERPVPPEGLADPAEEGDNDAEQQSREVPPPADGASDFGRDTAEQANEDGEGFGRGTSEDAEADGEGFGQQTAEDARPEGAGAPEGAGPGGRP